MRDLIIMRGCPGCGKSTAIEESGLKDYVLSPDNIRLMLRAPEVNEDGEYRISQQDNALVFKMLDEMWSCSIYEDDGDNDSDKFFCANVKSAWDLPIDETLEVANLYHIDIKGHMFESGMCFERDFEVDRNGNIIKDDTIKHDNYTWDSINPLIGG